MKRRLIFMAFFLSTLMTFAQFSGSGNGTEADPYLIYNETQLSQMANFLNQEGVVFKLMKDLDLTNWIEENNPRQGWVPVGVESTPFKGKFYGNNHKVTGLSINRASSNYVGFFGYVTNATIENLTIEGGSITGASYVGGFVGYVVNSAITNCHLKLTGDIGVKGISDVGGLAGYIASSTIKGGIISGAITVTGINSGGLAGRALDATITNTQLNCDVIGQDCTGGVVGYSNNGSFSNCTYKGKLTGKENVGGIVGSAEVAASSFTNCFTKGEIIATGNYTGGIVGVSKGANIKKMENCSHFGDITGQSYIGGLIGAVLNVVEAPTLHTYTGRQSSSGTIFTTYTESIQNGSSSTKSINNCTAIGNIVGTSYIGGLVGSESTTDGYSKTTHQTPYYYIYNNSSYTNNIYEGSTYIGREIYYYTYTRNTISYALTNSYYSGTLQGIDNIGGLYGYKSGGTIQNNFAYANIYGSSNVGGIVGKVSDEKNSDAYNTTTLKANFAINATISATVSDIGRIYGTTDAESGHLVVGAMASAEGNRALTQTKVIRSGVVQEINDNLQNGTSNGPSLLRLKATYVSMGWNFDEDWDILETECFPYKKYQAAPPVIESTLVSQNTEISGSSLNGGTVYLYYKDRDAVSTQCNGHAWTFTTEALQSGASIQLYADVEGMTPSYLTSATVGYPGSGTEADPYRIYTAEDLQGACNRGYYKLMNDIDLSAWINENSPTEGWVAIGRNSGEATYINGDGHKVTGLWINSTKDYTGLFSNFSAGVIKNLTVEVAKGKKVKGGNYTGILIGRNANGQLLNCTVKGDVEGTIHVGGVTGYSTNNTVNAINYEGTVTSSSASARVGGFAGLSANDAITAVHAYATITSTGADSYVGGAIGYMNGGTITKSHAENTLTATGTNNNVGGLIGCSKASITLSYATGNVTANGDNSYTGGLVGYAYNPITNCYSTAKTMGTYYTAGLCAYTFSTIDKCYAKGDVYGSRYGAGVVAQLDGNASSLTNSIAANNKLELTDQSSWGSRIIGGFRNGASEPNTSNYALATMQVSLNGVAQKKTDDAVEGIAKPASELMAAQTYIDLGWDYSSVWSIDEGSVYPYLLWEIDVNPVTEVTLDNSTLIIAQGKTATLTASVMPLGATNKRLEWKSSNTAIATVAEGVVTAVGIGSANITATSTDGSNVSATCRVTVVANKDAAIAELQALVDAAQRLYDNSTEGENIGQYQSGARAALLAVIRSVRAQISSTMDDTTIASCTNTINNAVATFKSKQVMAGEDTDIAAYENIVYIEGAEASAGSQAVLSIKMNNTIAPTGFQCDVYLPEGIEVATDEDGFYLIELSTARTTAKKTDYFNTAEQEDGSIRIMCSSTKSYTFAGNDGEVATITLNISNDIDEGTYPLILKNIVISDANATGAKIDYVKTTLTISSYTLGDVNADGDVNVIDFTAIANHIMGNSIPHFIEKAADVNGDNEINVMDLTGEANLILYGAVSPNANAAKARVGSSRHAMISVENYSMTTDGEITVDINIKGDYIFSGFQFDMILPEGLSLKNAEEYPCVFLSDERTNAQRTDYFNCQQTEEGAWRVLCASTRGFVFERTDGCVAHVTLVADSNIEEGNYEVTIGNGILAANASGVKLDATSFLVSVNDATSITGVYADKTAQMYDMTGRPVEKSEVLSGLRKGVYIMNGNKILK